MHHRTKRCMHTALAHAAAASPASSDPCATPGPENLVLSSPTDVPLHPRLSIFCHPGFVPATPGSSYFTEPFCFNRLNSRYTPAGLSQPGSATVFRTVESTPATFCVSREDWSPFVRIAHDGFLLRLL